MDADPVQSVGIQKYRNKFQSAVGGSVVQLTGLLGAKQ